MSTLHAAGRKKAKDNPSRQGSAASSRQRNNSKLSKQSGNDKRSEGHESSKEKLAENADVGTDGYRTNQTNKSLIQKSHEDQNQDFSATMLQNTSKEPNVLVSDMQQNGGQNNKGGQDGVGATVDHDESVRQLQDDILIAASSKDDKDDGEFTEDQQARMQRILNNWQIDSPQATQQKESGKPNDKEKNSHANEAVTKIEGADFYFRDLKTDLNKKFVIYDKRSCYLFKKDGLFKFRNKVVWLTCWPGFDNFIITLILVNSIMLAVFDYEDRDALQPRNQLIETLGLIFTYIFTLEAVIKIIAMGFIMHRNSYLRDAWNWLDFIVVCIGIFENIPGIPKLKALRTMRVLRPLRSVNAFPQMKRLIGSLLASIPALGNVVIFMFFIFLLFGILGVQQFKGTLYQRCRATKEPEFKYGDFDPDNKMWYWDKAELEESRTCSMVEGEGIYMCPNGYTCGSPTHSNALPKPYKFEWNETVFNSLMLTENYSDDDLIAYDLASFNDLIYGLQNIFVMITLEGWSGLMYNLSDATMSYMAIGFCVLLVVIGSFFLLNVILAVIMDAFDKVDKMHNIIEQQKRDFLKQQMKAYDIETTDSDDNGDPKVNPNFNQIIDEACLDADIKEEGQQKEVVSEIVEMVQIAKNNSTVDVNTNQVDLINQQIHGSTEVLDNTQNLKKQQSARADPSMEEQFLKSQDESQTQKLLQECKKGQEDDDVLKMDQQDKNDGSAPQDGEEKQDEQRLSAEFREHFNQEEIPERALKNKLFLFFFKICNDDIFQFSMTLAILINTLVLAMDRYPITYDAQKYLEYLNMVLSYIFIAEMVIKLLGMGIRDYCADSFNVFDGTVVTISIVEMIVSKFIEGGLGGGAISSLRAVRLLRVFKLARSWVSFRTLLGKMIITLKDIQYFACLMALFMFIFTLLCMELYAYRVKFNNDDHGTPIQDPENSDEEGIYPRLSFNNFLLGFTTIFIVFIGEDWNSVMYDHTRAAGVKSVIIFTLIFIVGNLIMLNLFLAILLQNFEEPPGKGEQAPAASTGPSAFQQFKENVVSCLCSCSPCCSKDSERQVQDESVAGGAEVLSNSEMASEGAQVISPKSKKSIQSMPLSEKDSNKKSDFLLDLGGGEDQNNFLSVGRKTNGREHYNTEVKNNYDIKEEDEQTPLEPKSPVSKKNFMSNEEMEQIKHTQRQLENIKSQVKDYPRGLVVKQQNPKAFIKWKQDEIKLKTFEWSQKVEKAEPLSDKASMSLRFSISQIKQMEVEAAEKPKVKALNVEGKALIFMDKDNAIRKCSTKIVEKENFDNFILFLIIFSTIMLCLESPLNDPKSEQADHLYYIDCVVSGLFTVELILKVLVFGFLFNGADSYLRNAWNIMDFIIVVFSLISLSLRDAGSKVSALKMLRMLRVLRPLRMISRNQGLKIAVFSLMNSIPFLVDVMVVSILFLLLFAILCTNFYKGAFWSCVVGDNVTANMSEAAGEQLQELVDSYVQNRFQCLDYGGEWVNTDSNFDNVGEAMISLFNVMTTEGWIDVMWSAVDSTSIEHVPEQVEFGASVILFLALIFFFHLFILNMFVGIVINVFSDQKQMLEKNDLLTQTQLDWCEVLIFCYKSQPEVKFITTGNMVKDTCYKVAMNVYFDRFILFCIVLNTGCLALNWHGEPESLKDYLDIFNLIFNIIYTIEASVKLIAFDYDYFKDGWNIFDFIIVVAAWFGFISSKIEGLDIGASTNLIRIFRISRIFKIIKKNKDLRILFYTFIGAIPQLTNVGSLLILCLLLYSVLGVELFATVQLQGDLTVHANFQTFGQAAITLFRMATGESWQAIMYDCMREKSITFECMDSPTFEDMKVEGEDELQIIGCGSKITALLYFPTFMIMVSFIFLNLFIAIILESFDTSKDEEGLKIGQDTISKFNEYWSMPQFDPKGTKFIEIEKFREFLKLIIDEECSQRILYNDGKAKGDIDLEDQTEIFMFNIHLDTSLLPIVLSRQPVVEQKLIENGEIENRNGPDEAAEAGGQSGIMAEGGNPVSDSEEKRNKVKIEEEKFLQKYKQNFDTYIGSMELPCYQQLKYFYYYDVLEALSRHLFQWIIDEQKKTFEAEDAQSKSSSSEKQPVESKSNSSMEFGEDLEPTEMEIEDKEDIMYGSLDQILKKLEDKGREHKDIEKYKEMRNLRVKRDKSVRQQLEPFTYEIDNKKYKSIIDSSQLVGARIISRYLKKYRGIDRNNTEQTQNKPANGDDQQQQQPVNPQKIEQKREANIKEKEVMRKKKAYDNSVNPHPISQIQETLNEDKDYQEGQQLIDGRNSRNHRTVEVDANYQTFQHSEPGNKQGDDGQGILTAQRTGDESGKLQLALEGASFDDYNRQESSEMQDIQSQNNGQFKTVAGVSNSRLNQHQRFNSADNS